jgi:flagellar biosynthesis GTPase FlhF
MGGRSGQGINRGNVTPTQNRQQRTLSDIRDEQEELQRLQREGFDRFRQITRELENATPEEREKLLQERERLNQERAERSQEVQRLGEEYRETQQAEADKRKAEDEDSFKDYNANVTITGQTNSSFNTGNMLSFTGVPKDFGGNISVTHYGNETVIRVSGEGVTMNRTIKFDSNGNPDYVYNSYFKIDEGTQHDKRGAEIFNNQVTSLRQAGFDRIEVSAAGAYNDNATFNGYYTWARFGYVPNDATLGVSSYNQYAQQEGYEKVSNFKEIMYTEQGREWWKNKGGVSFSGKFNLNKSSYSSTTMKNYMKERANR